MIAMHPPADAISQPDIKPVSLPPENVDTLASHGGASDRRIAGRAGPETKAQSRDLVRHTGIVRNHRGSDWAAGGSSCLNPRTCLRWRNQLGGAVGLPDEDYHSSQEKTEDPERRV